MAFQGKVPLGMDAVGSPKLYGELHERVLTGYALDAMEGRAGSAAGPGTDGRRQPTLERPPSVLAERFIEKMRDAERTHSESVGMGEYRVLKGHIVGSELVDQDKLVHLSAFPSDDYAGRWDRSGQVRPPRPGNTGPLQRPSERKRRY
jgi:hypothetical protein